MEALPAVPSAVRRVGRSNVWLVDSEERFVLRAHPAWNIGRSTLPEPFHSSGLVALAVAGLGTSASDTVMTRVEHSLEWVHELLLSLAGAEVIVPVPVPLLGGRTSRRFGNVLWETLSFVSAGLSVVSFGVGIYLLATKPSSAADAKTSAVQSLRVSVGAGCMSLYGAF